MDLKSPSTPDVESDFFNPDRPTLNNDALLSIDLWPYQHQSIVFMTDKKTNPFRPISLSYNLLKCV